MRNQKCAGPCRVPELRVKEVAYEAERLHTNYTEAREGKRSERNLANLGPRGHKMMVG